MATEAPTQWAGESRQNFEARLQQHHSPKTGGNQAAAAGWLAHHRDHQPTVHIDQPHAVRKVAEASKHAAEQQADALQGAAAIEALLAPLRPDAALRAKPSMLGS